MKLHFYENLVTNTVATNTTSHSTTSVALELFKPILDLLNLSQSKDTDTSRSIPHNSSPIKLQVSKAVEETVKTQIRIKLPKDT